MAFNHNSMPTQITQIEDPERGKTMLRVEGAMMYDDAVLLEKIALDLREQLGVNLTLDFADLDFLDSESAPILKRLEREHGFEIEGIEIFLQTIVNETEKRKS
jgi:hypothetical protein